MSGSRSAAVQNFRRALAHWGFKEYGLLLLMWGGMSAFLYLGGWGLFSVLSLPMFIGSIAALTYAAKRLMPNAPALSKKRHQLIEFFTTLDSIDLHGTLSFIEGVPRATWTTTDAAGEKNTVDAALSEADFRELWRAARWLHPLRRFVEKSPERELQARSHYVITIAFTDAEITYTDTLLVPHLGLPPKVEEWIRKIRQSSPRPASSAP